MIVYPVARAARPQNQFLLVFVPSKNSWRVEWTKTIGTYPDFYADTQREAMMLAAGIASPGDVLEVIWANCNPPTVYTARASRGGKADVTWVDAGAR
jgi:hypothetical protein